MSERLASWWQGGVPSSLKVVYLVLLANGLPAFVLLMGFPGDTDSLFVWTVKPEASAHLLGVMYGNAVLLVALGVMQRSWDLARATLVVIAFFAVAATVVTLFTLDPFLDHPWTHLAYWLSMYALLFFSAPVVLFLLLRRMGLRLPVDEPLRMPLRALAALTAVALAVTGIGLIFSTAFAADAFPWPLTPLVGRIVGVWLCALALAYAWSAWDGDWRRTRIIFIQGVPTGVALALLPFVHDPDLRPAPGAELAYYLGLGGLLAIGGAAAAVLQSRGAASHQPRSGV